MILDRLENAKQYMGIHPGIDMVLKEVLNITSENFPEERKILEEDRVFLNFGNYETAPVEVAKFEAHRAFIDVMCMIEGEEIIYVKNTDQLSHITQEYDEKRECLLAKFDTDNTPVLLTAGSFCILFPQDAHAPGQAVKAPQKVKKVIGKVRI